MIYEERDENGNIKTWINGTDKEVAEAIKNYKNKNSNRYNSSPTFEFTPKIIQKHITKYDTTNVQFSKSEVQKMFVGHEDELRKYIGKSIDNTNITSVFNATDILNLFSKNKDELRSIVANNLTSRNINISSFSYENLKDIYQNDIEALQNIVERSLSIEEEKTERLNHDANVRNTLCSAGVFGLLGGTIAYIVYKAFKDD